MEGGRVEVAVAGGACFPPDRGDEREAERGDDGSSLNELQGVDTIVEQHPGGDGRHRPEGRSRGDRDQAPGGRGIARS